MKRFVKRFVADTHICGRSRRGTFQLQRKSRTDRMRATLRRVKDALRRRMHQPIPVQGRWLTQVVRGYFAYHAVPTNRRALMAFRHHVTDLWRRTLRRRVQASPQPKCARSSHPSNRDQAGSLLLRSQPAGDGAVCEGASPELGRCEREKALTQGTRPCSSSAMILSVGPVNWIGSGPNSLLQAPSHGYGRPSRGSAGHAPHGGTKPAARCRTARWFPACSSWA